MREVTWILMANRSTSILLEDDGCKLHELKRFYPPMLPDEGAPRGRRAPQPEQAPSSDPLAKKIGAVLDKAEAMHLFHHLVILTSPPFMKEIEAQLSSAVQKTVLSSSGQDDFSLLPKLLALRVEAYFGRPVVGSGRTG